MTNNLRKRNGVWCFRRRVPQDLIEHYGKQEITRSLRTKDYAVAKVLVAAMTVEYDAEFLAIRKSREPSAAAKRAIVSTEHESHALADEWHDERIANREYHEETGARIRQATAALEATGQIKPEPLPLYPHEQEALKPAAKRETLRDIVPSWVMRTAADSDAKKRTDRALDLFEQAVGILPVRDLRKAHGAKFVLFLLDKEKRKFTAKTAANHASCISALMNVAVKDDVVEVNPFDLTIDKTRDSSARGPWSDDELETLYKSPLFSDKMDAVKDWFKVNPRDMRALLLILQHTGARIGEPAQMRRGDFVTQSGIKAMRFTEDAGTLKTDESRRTVPIADHLLADPWFGKWLAGIMDGTDKDGPAFPSLHTRKKAPGDRAVEWFKEFRASTGLPAGPLNGSHRFRHWIRTAMNALDVAVATQDAITGHATGGSTGNKVYTSIPLHVMQTALNRVAYPSIAG